MARVELSHLDNDGKARMVDVSIKSDTERIAVSQGEIRISKSTLNLIIKGLSKKGDVLAVAQLAGILGAKKTSELIPLCHQINLTHIDVQLEINEDSPSIKIVATAKTIGKTGVEMEALTAVSISALTIYDMVKAVDKTMVIHNIHLLEKHGGTTGDFSVKSNL